MNDTRQWITDRLPTEADAARNECVVRPADGLPGWQPAHHTKIRPGEPWAPYPSMPPYVPPAPSYRPWTPEEAVGKVVRRKGADCFLVIICAYQDHFYLDSTSMSWAALENDYEQPDGSPCGVEDTP